MGILESINLEVIDLGESPLRLGGMKVGLPDLVGESVMPVCMILLALLAQDFCAASV